MRRGWRIAGALALASALFWMVTGMGWWSPTNTVPGDFSNMGREMAIALTHFIAMAGALLSYAE